MYHPWRWKRLDRQRRARLIRKAQQAGVVDRLPDLQALPSWNKRFRAVQQLRSVRHVAG